MKYSSFKIKKTVYALFPSNSYRTQKGLSRFLSFLSHDVIKWMVITLDVVLINRVDRKSYRVYYSFCAHEAAGSPVAEETQNLDSRKRKKRQQGAIKGNEFSWRV